MADSYWHPDVLAKIREGIQANVEKAAIYLKGKLKEALNETGNPYIAARGAKGPHYKNENPSLEGEAPHKMLGDLQRSVTYEMQEGTAVVGTNLEYGKYLEFGSSKVQARPWLRSTLLREAERI